MEVLSLKLSWHQIHGYSLPVKSRIPSWALIENICASSNEIGFLPDFLGKKSNLQPVLWQPAPSQYRILAIYRIPEAHMQKRFDDLIQALRSVFIK